MSKILITGGCGFLGSNLAYESLKRAHDLCVLDNLSRLGADKNLAWLQKSGMFRFEQADVRNAASVDNVVINFKPDIIFHVAGQVAMTTSIANPRLDFETNTLGTFNVLEAVRRHNPAALILYSSTNKVFGDLENLVYTETDKRYRAGEYPNGFPETLPLDFRSPYGCSKGAADQYLLDYARIFSLSTVVFRHSSIYGSRQFSTFDQGWIGWFIQKAVEQAQNPSALPFTIAGNGKQVRDVLYADDAVNCYFAAVQHIQHAKGQAFNIGGGMENSFSLLELFDLLANLIGKPLRFAQIPWRQSDQKVFVADTTKAARLLHWIPQVAAPQGVRAMFQWVSQPPKS
ncbi:MAG TPA: GDP-mannose 4,6-dehydratase [Phycisphaerae bacterium]|jgi:CDP-paratose 2-epimerase